MSLLGVKQYGSRKGAEESKSGYVKHWLLKVLQGLQFYAHSPKDKAPESCPPITWLACPNNGLTKCASSNSMGNRVCILVNAIPQVFTYSGKEGRVHIDCAG